MIKIQVNSRFKSRWGHHYNPLFWRVFGQLPKTCPKIRTKKQPLSSVKNIRRGTSPTGKFFTFVLRLGLPCYTVLYPLSDFPPSKVDERSEEQAAQVLSDSLRCMFRQDRVEIGIDNSDFPNVPTTGIPWLQFSRRQNLSTSASI